ncbi:histidine kinase [Methylophaga sp.]|uniref:sensor histidine kinase n=1 Tax=Methylophaga sp. TaxID=2024840 RepID=UPI003F6A1D77
MNLRFRLNLVVTLVLLVILSIGAVVVIHNARQNVQAEVQSTMDLALHMLNAELTTINQNNIQASVVSRTSPFNLRDLAGVRHLRIAFYDDNNRLIETNLTDSVNKQKQPPSWFMNQMHSALESISEKVIPISINGQVLGKLVVSPEPGNEVSEAWKETKTILYLIVLFFIIVNVLLYFAVARSLKPIDTITEALTDIETGQLDRRLPVFKLPEMSIISHKFNLMAAALQSSINNNHRLTQQIIRLQEAERKRLAHELHDEIGQHLTAIHVDASVIKTSPNLESARKSAAAIDDVVRRMMEIVRTMLRQLRPDGLDELGFVIALQELVNNWKERHQNIDVEVHFDGDFKVIDEAVQLTLYRVMQECLTNISRHSKARQVWISLTEKNKNIQLEVIDNGQGFDLQQHRHRFGLAGMKERVDSVQGKLIIKASLNEGVTIDVTIPKQGGLT